MGTMTPFERAMKIHEDRYGAMAADGRHWRRTAFGLFCLLTAVGRRHGHHGPSKPGDPLRRAGRRTRLRGLDRACRGSEPGRRSDRDRASWPVLSRPPNRAFGDPRPRGADSARHGDGGGGLSRGRPKRRRSIRRSPRRPAARRGSVDCEVKAVLPMAQDAWQVDWAEHHYESGRLVETRAFKAVVTVAIEPTRSLSQVLQNPLGIYVVDFHVTEVG